MEEFRTPQTTSDLLQSTYSVKQLRYASDKGALQRICQGAYVYGPGLPSRLEGAIGIVLAANAIASGTLAARLYQLDGVELSPPFGTVIKPRQSARAEIRSCRTPLESVMVAGIPCTDGLQTMLDLASYVSDKTWEQAFESALRKRICTVAEVEDAVARRRSRAALRIKRVLAMRPPHAPPTESLLETLMVQLIRTSVNLPEPERQVEIRWSDGRFIARVDLCWQSAGVFVELDGQQHMDQREYDTTRETEIIAATGWHVARFTWRQVTSAPNATLRRLTKIYDRGVQRGQPQQFG